MIICVIAKISICISAYDRCFNVFYCTIATALLILSAGGAIYLGVYVTIFKTIGK